MGFVESERRNPFVGSAMKRQTVDGKHGKARAEREPIRK
jgi:hypothetical protein